MENPKIIQGGMGIAVSSWSLARAVSLCGQLGVISGTALDVVFCRRLQLGDPGGQMRLAVDHFPMPEMAERVWNRYFVDGGKQDDQPFKSKPNFSNKDIQALLELTILANFCEVFLAKLGHAGQVGINLLEKIQLPTVPSLFGAMLAGVDYVLMGAGIPRNIPGYLDKLAELEQVELKFDVHGALAGEENRVKFAPKKFTAEGVTSLKRPKFLAIVSSSTLALSLSKKSSGKVDGFIVEGKTAGGHNAPPRGGLRIDERGEPIYGPRDEADLSEFRAIGLPFWLAGSYADPCKLEEAIAEGAEGIQVGTAFAFCEESGMDAQYKHQIIEKCLGDDVSVFTDALASPTGFPFKVVLLEDSLSAAAVYEERERICDLGYLRQAYREEDGKVGFRCPAEPVEDYLRKGGALEDTVGRKCVCNGLMATIGLGQIRKDGTTEAPIITAGDDVRNIAKFVPPGKNSYHAADVIHYLLRAAPVHAGVTG